MRLPSRADIMSYWALVRLVLPRDIKRTETQSAGIIFCPAALVSAAAVCILKLSNLDEVVWKARAVEVDARLDVDGRCGNKRQDVVLRLCGRGCGNE